MLKKIFKLVYRFTFSLKLRCILFRLMKYKVGSNTYIPPDLKISDIKSHKYNVLIGDRVSIGPGVILITDSSPNNSLLKNHFPLLSGKIQICDDAWLGAGVIILPNVTIGKCSIVAAGAVVTKSVPDNTIVAGVPAKLINRINNCDS